MQPSAYQISHFLHLMEGAEPTKKWVPRMMVSGLICQLFAVLVTIRIMIEHRHVQRVYKAA
jgi:hypothetical protein